jgi:DNA-binding HxlR family transcriptional regulator
MSKWAEVGDTVCPVARSTAIVGHRWTMLIIRELFAGCTRFDEIQAQTGATAQMLAARLKRLETEGLIERRVYSRRPNDTLKDAIALTIMTAVLLLGAGIYFFTLYLAYLTSFGSLLLTLFIPVLGQLFWLWIVWGTNRRSSTGSRSRAWFGLVWSF